VRQNDPIQEEIIMLPNNPTEKPYCQSTRAGCKRWNADWLSQAGLLILAAFPTQVTEFFINASSLFSIFCKVQLLTASVRVQHTQLTTLMHQQYILCNSLRRALSGELGFCYSPACDRF